MSIFSLFIQQLASQWEGGEYLHRRTEKDFNTRVTEENGELRSEHLDIEIKLTMYVK